MTPSNSKELRAELWAAFESVPSRDTDQPMRSVIERYIDIVADLITSKQSQLIDSLIEQMPKAQSFNYGGTNVTTTYQTDEDAVKHGFNQGIAKVLDVLNKAKEELK